METLVVLAILMLLLALVIFPFANFRDRQVLQMGAQDVLSTLAKARTQTLSGLNDSAYGVHLAADRLVLFVGDSYNAADPNNQTVLLNSSVTISGLNLTGGASDIAFRRLTGTATKSGTIAVALVADATQTKTITIAGSGVAWVN